MELNHILSRLGKQLSDYIRPDQPGDIPPSMVSAIELAKNNVFAGFFSFREYDDQKGLVHPGRWHLAGYRPYLFLHFCRRDSLSSARVRPHVLARSATRWQHHANGRVRVHST